MNPADAERAMDAGSEFIITPVMLPDVIDWCAKRNIVCVPGCQTPTELHMAYMCGAPLQKLFPGVAGGPMWVKAVSSALVRCRSWDRSSGLLFFHVFLCKLTNFTFHRCAWTWMLCLSDMVSRTWPLTQLRELISTMLENS